VSMAWRELRRYGAGTRIAAGRLVVGMGRVTSCGFDVLLADYQQVGTRSSWGERTIGTNLDKQSLTGVS